VVRCRDEKVVSEQVRLYISTLERIQQPALDDLEVIHAKRPYRSGRGRQESSLAARVRANDAPVADVKA